eukprot:403369602
MADGKKLQVRNRRVAQQILDSIEQLESEPDSVKRWIWELLQNAQDSAIPGCKQGSSKERPQRLQNPDINAQNPNQSILANLIIPETTGRYGTGFLTTYLLSKNLEIQGIFLHEDEDLGVDKQYRTFSLKINRDAEDIEQMDKLNLESLKVFKDLENPQKCPLLKNYIPGQTYDSVFIYHLNENGYENAFQGFTSLMDCSPYNTTAFHNEILFEEYQSDRIILYSEERYSQLAVEIEHTSNKGFKIHPKNFHVTNFFVDYPLIGFDDLKLAVIFNSHAFYPNEKRSGLNLELGRKGNTNKEIMNNCRINYQKFLQFVIQEQYQGLNNLLIQLEPGLKINKVLKEILVDLLIIDFLNSPVIETVYGLASLKNAKFPKIKQNIQSNYNQQHSDLWYLGSVIHFSDQTFVKNDTQYIEQWIHLFQDNDWKNHLKQQNLVTFTEMVLMIIIKTYWRIKVLKLNIIY